jgi:hypothetical protein
MLISLFAQKKRLPLEVGMEKKKGEMTCLVNGHVTAKALSQFSTGSVPTELQRKRMGFTIREMLTKAAVLEMIS